MTALLWKTLIPVTNSLSIQSIHVYRGTNIWISKTLPYSPQYIYIVHVLEIKTA